RDARIDELERALLDAEERGQLLVVHLRPEADERGADEPGVVAEPQRVGDGRREREAGDQSGGRHRHREPERRAHDERAAVRGGRSATRSASCTWSTYERLSAPRRRRSAGETTSG